MLISELISIFHSRMKAQEIILLLENAKQIVRQGFYKQELPAIQTFCQQNSLPLVQSKFKILLDDKHNFTNKGLRIPETDKREGLYFIYISKDERLAYLASYYELINNYQELGRLLGYPPCCIRFFINSFHENNPNPQHKPTNPWTNLTQREDDFCLLSHFPCSSNCSESVQQAQHYFNVIKDNHSDYAQKILQTLSKDIN
ncbi:DUF483 domain-containing protein [Candidatus Woesearchaeota archaeon]|nr:DUF483 domain-containing protein [Candidatus Woesearchaeota archaeon]